MNKDSGQYKHVSIIWVSCTSTALDLTELCDFAEYITIPKHFPKILKQLSVPESTFQVLVRFSSKIVRCIHWSFFFFFRKLLLSSLFKVKCTVRLDKFCRQTFEHGISDFWDDCSLSSCEVRRLIQFSVTDFRAWSLFMARGVGDFLTN